MIGFSKEKFAKRLAELMEEKGLNNQTLGDAVGIPRTSISNWRNCRRTVQVDAIIKLAHFFDVTTDYMLGIVDLI